MACPRLPEGHRFEVVPDWVCEVLSSSTKSTDREEKMPLYARYRVAYAWLVDPKTRALEAYRLADGGWVPVGVYLDDDKARVPPFDAVAIRLSDLWG